MSRGRPAPHNLAMEQAVLGACLIDADSAIPAAKEHILKPEDFHDPHHRWIWEAMATLEQRRRNVDFLTVVGQLQATLETEVDLDGRTRRRSRLEIIGGAAEIEVLTTAAQSAAHVGSYAQVVADRAADRRIRECSLELDRLAYDESLTAPKKAALVAQATERALAATSRKGPVTLTQACLELSDFLCEQADRRAAAEERGEVFDPNLLGLPTGFRGLDRITGGVVPGQPWVLGARASMGKTAMMMGMVRSFVRFGSVYVSLADGAAIALARREVARWHDIPIRSVTAGHAVGAAEDLEKDYGNRVYIDEDSTIFADEAAARVALKKAQDPGVIAWLLDYLSLYSKSLKWEDVAETSRIVTRTGKRLNIATVALQQLKQGVDDRKPDEQRPRKGDLAESNQIERDAKVIVAPYRPWKSEPEKYSEDQAEIWVLKNSDGPLGKVNVLWDKRTASFVDPPPKVSNVQGKLDEINSEDVPG